MIGAKLDELDPPDPRSWRLSYCLWRLETLPQVLQTYCKWHMISKSSSSSFIFAVVRLIRISTGREPVTYVAQGMPMFWRRFPLDSLWIPYKTKGWFPWTDLHSMVHYINTTGSLELYDTANESPWLLWYRVWFMACLKCLRACSKPPKTISHDSPILLQS